MCRTFGRVTHNTKDYFKLQYASNCSYIKSKDQSMEVKNLGFTENMVYKLNVSYELHFQVLYELHY